MIVYVQWAKADAEDWISFDLKPTGPSSRLWRNLPKKPLPTGTETLDNNPGWIFDVNIQGVLLGGYDHYAAEPVTDPTYGFGIRATMWNDDPEDWPVGTRHATQWTFFEPRSDPKVGGQINTLQFKTYWLEANAPQWAQLPQSTSGGPVQVFDWADFVPPANAITVHGIWVPSEQPFVENRAMHGWREWIT